MNNLLLVSAGHIDHGKTALITALNGFKGDTTNEEKRRGITIDLSFSHLANENTNIAFIDAPGHENLLKTMISGAFGADCVLLVVACNEGLKPQSLEHIKITHLLGIKNVILALTKSDLADFKQIQKVKNECLNELEKYENFSVLATFELSIKDEGSINKLKEFLFALKPAQKLEFPLPKYYIDRLFSIKGAGLVTTATLQGASISKDEKLFDYDANVAFSVRGLQVHDSFVLGANAGQRVAINIACSDTSRIKKGDFISKKGYFRAFNQIDAIFFGQIKHNENAIFCIGTKSVNAKITLLASNENSHFITLKLEKPVFASFDEHYILLENSRLLGGGRILNPVSEPMKKPQKIMLLKALLKRDFAIVFDILKSTHEKGFGLICAPQRFALAQDKALEIAKSLKNAIIDEEALNIYDISVIKDIKDFIKFIISKNELAMFSATSIALKLPWASAKIAQIAIDELAGILEFKNGLYFKKGADFSKLKESLEAGILREIENGGLSPLAPYNIYDIFEVDRKAGDDALKRLCAKNLVIRLEHNLFVSKNNLKKAKITLKEIITKNGFVDAQSAKTALNLSRKYVIAYLEALDSEPDIIKVEQKRVFKK